MLHSIDYRTAPSTEPMRKTNLGFGHRQPAPAAVLAFHRVHRSTCGPMRIISKNVYYDPGPPDELVIVVLYRGTNPDHQFSLEMGGRVSIVAATGTRSSLNYWTNNTKMPRGRTTGKTVRMSLAGMDCRPAAVTLRTAPRFDYTLTVSGAAAAGQ